MKKYYVPVTVFDFTGVLSTLGADVLSMAVRFLSEMTVALVTRAELAPIRLNR